MTFSAAFDDGELWTSALLRTMFTEEEPGEQLYCDGNAGIGDGASNVELGINAGSAHVSRLKFRRGGVTDNENEWAYSNSATGTFSIEHWSAGAIDASPMALLLGQAAGVYHLRLNTGHIRTSRTDAATAGTTQTQAGGTLLHRQVIRVATANDLDAITACDILSSDSSNGAFSDVMVWNDTAVRIQLFPGTGDAIRINGQTLSTNSPLIVPANALLRLTGGSNTRLLVEMTLDGATNNITASATQTQGQQRLFSKYNRVSTIATDNDVVTLPKCYEGLEVAVRNDDAAQVLQIFPDTGDSITTGATDASTTLAINNVLRFVGVSSTNWRTF